MRALMRGACAATLAVTLWLQAPVATAQTAAGDATAPSAAAPAATPAVPAAPTVVAQANTATAAPAPAATNTKPVINGADTAWMLISTVLVLLMTIPGIILFYGGMLRTKNALSRSWHTRWPPRR